MDDRIQSGKEFAKVAADLTDDEIQKTVQIVNSVRLRYAGKPNTVENLEDLRDEVLTRLSEIGVLATLDPAPCFYGEPPTVEIIGKVDDPGFQKPFDHEKKQYEVRKATDRGEDFLGQKERPNKRRSKG